MRYVDAVNESGPFLQCAVICERVLQEADGVVSAIRIIDRLVLPDLPATELAATPLQIPLNLLVTIKSGDARGKHHLEIAPTAPSGFKLPSLTMPILLEGDERGINLIGGYLLQVQEEGLYWFPVLIDGELATKIPLRVLRAGITVSIPPQL